MSDTCPYCGSEPATVSSSLSPKQEMCSNDDCPVRTWDPTVDGSPSPSREIAYDRVPITGKELPCTPEQIIEAHHAGVNGQIHLHVWYVKT